MAKFRKAFKKASKRMLRASRRSGPKASSNTSTIAAYAAGYGLIRNKAQSLAAPITSKVPSLGPVSSYSLVAGVAGYLMAKKGRGMVANAGKAILVSEAFVAGSGVNLGGSSTSSGIVLN